MKTVLSALMVSLLWSAGLQFTPAAEPPAQPGGKPAAQKDSETNAVPCARLCQAMADLVAARAAKHPDKARIADLTSKVATLRRQLAASCPLRTGPAANCPRQAVGKAQAADACPCCCAACADAGNCPWSGAAGWGRGGGKGFGPGWGRGGKGFGPGWGRGQGFGPGARGQDAEFRTDRETFHYLLDNRGEITRKVKKLANGVETVTESADQEIAARIQEHVAAMYQRVKEGRPIHLRDPLFAEVFRNAAKIQMTVHKTDRGVRVVETSEDPYVARLIQAHAEVVNRFVANGRWEMRNNHPVPE